MPSQIDLRCVPARGMLAAKRCGWNEVSQLEWSAAAEMKCRSRNRNE
ncbi:MAG: hypothetical protein ACR2PR_06445 [Pseudohongiellaceae bacterium]